MDESISDEVRRLEIPGRITAAKGKGGLVKLDINTDWSTAEIYLHGAHLSAFQKNGDAPLLFTSQASRYEFGIPIRGGVPIIFPWFGARERKAAHGFARTSPWKLHETSAVPSGGVSARFHLADSPERAEWPIFSAVYVVTVTDRLLLDLLITNQSDRDLVFENCLHTYFQIGDVATVSVKGLKGVEYLDKTENFARKMDLDERILIQSEVDRTYIGTQDSVEIHDTTMKRTIIVEKHGSLSTVVWNPWIDKAKAMADFGDDEYKTMVCVESGNVAENKITLKPGRTQVLEVMVNSVGF